MNVVSVLLLFGWRLKVRDDRRWQVALPVGGVSALARVATSLGEFGALHPAIAVALVLVTVLTAQGFGFLLPGELRMDREMRSATPDPSVIATVGKQNAMLGGVQGAFQLRLVLDMVSLRYGAFPF